MYISRQKPFTIIGRRKNKGSENEILCRDKTQCEQSLVKNTHRYIFSTLIYRLLNLLGSLTHACKSLHKFKHNTKPTKLILHLSAHKGLQFSRIVFINIQLKRKTFQKTSF